MCLNGGIALGALSGHRMVSTLCGSELRPHTGREQSNQAAARPCSEGRGLVPGCEDIVFPSDCPGQMQSRREQ